MQKATLQRALIASAVGALVTGWGSGASAAGFQLQEQNASGLGVAYSGQAAAANDASTVFWNPAGMSLLPGIQGAVALNYINASTKFTDNGSTLTPLGLGNGGQGGNDAFLPAVYGTWMINPQWSVGLGINAPFGLAIEWDTPWVGQIHAIKSEVKTIDINPSVSFKVNPMLSLGVGVSYQNLDVELTQATSASRTPNVAKIKGDSWDWGWNAGALISFNQGATRVGLTYRSNIKHGIDADLTNGPVTIPVNADVKLPDTFSIGVSHQLDPKTRLLADWTWTGWGTLKQVNIVSRANGATLQTLNLQFDDSWRLGAGVEYQVNQPWLLRAGIVYDTTPVQDEFRTPRLPDENRFWLALGARYQADPTWWLDFGYTYIWIDNASSNLPATTQNPTTLVGEYKAHVQILGAQVSFKF